MLTIKKTKRLIKKSPRILLWALNRAFSVFKKKEYVPKKLTIPTYDHSGQSAHPSILYFDEEWNGYNYWMAFTPYTDGYDQVENPSIVVSNDGVNWEVPSGLSNPIVVSPGTNADYLSDPYIFMYKDEMHLIYREYFRSCDPHVERWYIMNSNNGVNWSEPKEITYSDESINVSACIVFDRGRFYMYSVKYSGGKFDCLQRAICTSDPTKKENWSNPEKVNFEGLSVDRVPWHIEVFLNEEGTWEMLLVSSTGIGGAQGRLHFAYSNDGVNWVINQEPFLTPQFSFENNIHYKATMLKHDENTYKLWYSANNLFDKWSIQYLSVKKENNNLTPL